MASGKVADYGQIRKEKSKNGRLWGEGMRVREKMNGVRESRLQTDPQEKSKNRRIWGEGMRVRGKVNGVGGNADCGQIRKEQGKGRGMWWGEATWVRKSEEFWKMKGSRIRHQ